MSTYQVAGPPLSEGRAYNPAVLQWLIQGPGDLRRQVASWNAADWEAARWSIQVHGIAPLLYVASQDWPDADALDPGLRTYLATQAQWSRERVTMLLAELAEILTACHVASIPAKQHQGTSECALTHQIRPRASLGSGCVFGAVPGRHTDPPPGPSPAPTTRKVHACRTDEVIRTSSREGDGCHTRGQISIRGPGLLSSSAG